MSGRFSSDTVVAADEHCLVRFRTTVSEESYLEEDGEVWSPGGTLLAQSRQLAVILSG